MSYQEPRFYFINVPVAEPLHDALNREVMAHYDVVSVTSFEIPNYDNEHGTLQVSKYWSIIVDRRPAGGIHNIFNLLKPVMWSAAIYYGYEFLHNYGQSILEWTAAIIYLILHGLK